MWGLLKGLCSPVVGLVLLVYPVFKVESCLLYRVINYLWFLTPSVSVLGHVALMDVCQWGVCGSQTSFPLNHCNLCDGRVLSRSSPFPHLVDVTITAEGPV